MNLKILLHYRPFNHIIFQLDDYYDPKEDRPRMKHPKIKYHPQMTAFDLDECAKNLGDKNWLNLQCSKICFSMINDKLFTIIKELIF